MLLTLLEINLKFSTVPYTLIDDGYFLFIEQFIFIEHLQCIGLEQTPTKWISEASGSDKVTSHISILGSVPDYVVS